MSERERWLPASRLRRLLAVYLDFVLFSAPWGRAVWWLSEVFPSIEKEVFWLRLLFFLALESIVFRFVRTSPGHLLLGMVRIEAPGRPEAAGLAGGCCWCS